MLQDVTNIKKIEKSLKQQQILVKETAHESLNADLFTQPIQFDFKDQNVYFQDYFDDHDSIPILVLE